jgi:hypothetical protein
MLTTNNTIHPPHPRPLSVSRRGDGGEADEAERMVIKFNVCKIILFLIITALLVLSCSDYNPFTDDSNANVVVLSKTFNSGDTVSIFSTVSIVFVVTIPELVDSVKVVAVGNRLFSDNTWKSDLCSDKNFKSGTQILKFSFNDEGRKVIEILTYRKSGDVMRHEEFLFLKSPLFQNPIKGVFNTDLHLYTDPVSDKDIKYVWDFKDTVIESSSNSIGVKLLSAGKLDRGLLYVTDGVVESPKVQFQFNLEDTICPLISFVNDEPLVNDTITTGNSEFPLRVLVTDIGNNDSIAVAIKNEFGKILKIDIQKDSLYIKVFAALDTLKSPMPVVVSAQDNSLHINKVEKKIWIKYDSSKEKTRTFSLSLLIPSKESLSSKKTRTLYGLIRRYTKDTLPVQLTFSNNNENVFSIPVITEDWYQQITLSPGTNRIKVVAQKGSEFDSTYRLIQYDTLLSDTANPVILEIAVNGSTGDNLFVSQRLGSLKVIAFDEGGGDITTVTCNGNPLIRDEKSVYLWTCDSVALEHSLIGNVLEIVAKSGVKSVSKKITVFYNHRPVITKGPQFPSPVIVGKTYSTSIEFEDRDVSDLAIFTLENTFDSSMSIDNKGNLSWTPLKEDEKIKKKNISITIFDEYEYVHSSFEAIVADTGQVFENVKFGKVLEQFPGFLEANKDTIHVNLLPEKGTPEYSYQVDILGTTGSLPVVNDSLSWCPSSSDLGIVRMRIVVTDFILTTDTLYPVITVVPKNQPPTLLCEKITDTLVTGALNLRDSSKTLLLHFSISDLDQDIAEKFTAYVMQGGVTDTIDLKTNRVFSVSVNSSFYKYGTDTLRVLVTDRVGHFDQFQKAIDYGIEPKTPSLAFPLNNSIIDTNHVILKWIANNDPEIRYELYFGPKNKEMNCIYRGIDTSFVIEKLDTTGIHIWQVFATNGKERIASPLWTFNFNISENVKIETTDKAFKKCYTVGRDTINVPLRLVKSNQNVTFTAFYQKDSVPLLVTNSVLLNTPQIKDTGWQRIEIIAKDTINLISDTLFVDLFIAAESLNLKLQVENNNLSSDTLDLRAVPQNDTLVFSIETPVPGLKEDYTIEVTQRNTTRTFFLDSANTFSIIVEPGSHGLVSDSLEVKVTGTILGSDTKKITVLYNVDISESVSSDVTVDMVGDSVRGLLK